MRILFTGGGSGGHIFPIIAVARQLKKINNQLELSFLGAPAGAGFSNVLQQEGIKTKIILAGKMRRYFSAQIILDILKAPIGLIQAFWYLYTWMPDVIFSKGGFGSVPVVLVGWLFRIPILTHESDTIPGLANRLGAKFSKRIAVSFVSTGKYFPSQKTALIGNPIRSAIPMTSEKARTILGLSGQKPIIFILGGSQGAQALNQAILGILPQLLEKYEIVHQCGSNNLEEIKQKTSQILSGYHLFPFLDESQMNAAQLLANLVISRAGAGSIAEIAASGKPSILVPLSGSAADHQKSNSFAYAQAGAATVIEEENLTPSIFLSEISQILDNPELSRKISINAKNFSRPEAAQKIAETLIEMGK